MSWEEMSTSQTVCPCGKGKITQKSYGDDWNRYQDGPVIIECEECAKKYKVEEECIEACLPPTDRGANIFCFLKTIQSMTVQVKLLHTDLQQILIGTLLVG